MPIRNSPFSARQMHSSEMDERTRNANLRSFHPRQDSSTSDSREVDNPNLQSSIISDSSHGESGSEIESRTGSAQHMEESVASLSAAFSEGGDDSFSNPGQASNSQADLKAPSRRDQLSSKLRILFNLEEEEEVISSHSCWIFRSVLLQGYLYLTTSHICFYAYLPSREDRVLKASWIGKKTQRTHRFSKHWAILKGSVLSWYENERDPYFPQGHIDLRHAFNCDPSVESSTQFTVGTSQRKFIFNVDSESNRDDWVKIVRKALFRSHNEGESVRISIPLETIVDLDTTSSSSLTSINHQSTSSQDQTQGDMVCLKVVDDQNDDFSVDEYYFLHFVDQDDFLEKLRNGMNEMLRREGNLVDSNLTTGTKVRRSGVLDTTTGSKASGLSLSEENFLKPQDESLEIAAGTEHQSEQEVSTETEPQTLLTDSNQQEQRLISEASQAPFNEEATSTIDAGQTVSIDRDPSTSTSNATYPPSPSSTIPPTSFSRFQKDSENTWMVPRWMRETSGKILTGNTLARLPFPRRKVMEAWSTLSTNQGTSTHDDDDGLTGGNETKGDSRNRSESISREFDLDESGHLAFSVVEVEETAPALEKEELVEKHFRECFAVPKEEKLLAHLSASLYRVLPSAGRLFISATYLCFRSSRLASKTVGRTLVSVSRALQLKFQIGTF